VGFAWGFSSSAFLTFAGRRIAPDVAPGVERVRGGQPMRATSAVMRDASITVTDLGAGGVAARIVTACP
jgi:hypothetical protein